MDFTPMVICTLESFLFSGQFAFHHSSTLSTQTCLRCVSNAMISTFCDVFYVSKYTLCLRSMVACTGHIREWPILPFNVWQWSKRCPVAKNRLWIQAYIGWLMCLSSLCETRHSRGQPLQLVVWLSSANDTARPCYSRKPSLQAPLPTPTRARRSEIL